MSFGVLFDFTGNSNVSKVIKAADMIKEEWFIDAVNYAEPIGMISIHPGISTTNTETRFVCRHWSQPNPDDCFVKHNRSAT
jgi:hypothetical protein